MVRAQAEGWYHDPYGVHEDRWFSRGIPTKLVRDDGQEAYDEPPDAPLPEGELIPAGTGETEQRDGTDLRRADEACDDSPYSAAAARRAAFDVWNIGWPI
jgi:hypothetical protein